MDRDENWEPRVVKGSKPIYLAIADAIAEDIRDGRLFPGAKLPPLRVLAERLGLDFTTVSRAYSEAGRRGLIVGRVGQGTFVRTPSARSAAQGEAAAAVIDMTMNAPPLPASSHLLERMRSEMSEAALGMSPRRMLGYGDNVGAEEDRAAGAYWLRDRIPDLAVERIIVCPGAQGAMLALLSSWIRPGATILCEELTYPGMKALAAHLGFRLVGVAMDRDGILPDAFREACRSHHPKAFYCNPTLHNPTATTLSAERRSETAAIAREFGLLIIEDDAYGMLPMASPPPFAALAPDITFHIAGLAKCVAPALRIAYLVAPDPRQAMRIATSLRATMLMASPTSAAMATRWIMAGTAQAALDGIRAEARVRQQLAVDLLPQGSFYSAPDAFHLWLQLPEEWSRAEFAAHLRVRGIAAVGSDAFAVSQTPPEGLRVCLGTLPDHGEARRVLALIADLFDQSPAVALSVV